MPNILVRNVPEDVHARLVGRAEAAGVSLQQYVLDLLVGATARMTTQEAVAMLRARAADRRARGETTGFTVEEFIEELHAGREERADHLLEVMDEARARRGRLGDG
jgi:plasmid stability protein